MAQAPSSSDPIPALPDPPAQGPEVCYQDESLIIIDKPHWLLSVPGRLPQNKDSALTRLEKKYGPVFVVHRIDCATRGLMLFAKTKVAQSKLSKAFQKRQVHKSYEAVVAGRPALTKGRIEFPLSVDWPNRPKQKVDYDQGKAAETHYQLLSCEELTTRLALTPITGRSHQLRVHLATLGHPILGDRLYAPPEWVTPFPYLKLFSIALTFMHPNRANEQVQIQLNTKNLY